jgi:tetratricopeptide (TPR) repeat protein
MEKDLQRDDTLEFEIQFYEGVIEKKGNFLQALMALGDLYTKKGDFVKGLEIDRKLALMRPDDSLVLYNLACSLSLVQKIDEAFEVIQKAIQCGYDDLDYLLKDKDLENLLRDPRFQPYFSRLVKTKDAIGKKKS